jgi:SAM-dependent methyltransferase
MIDANNRAFYDELASYYNLIFADWNASMKRQGEAIFALLARCLPDCGGAISVLDASAGIGTQSLPLAMLGCRVSSRDLSPASVERLRHEATRRSLVIDAAVADMRAVNRTVETPVDAVLAFDNSVPHLQSDEDILAAFRSFYAALRPGGVCLLSVRDYEKVAREGDTVHPYGVRWRDGVRYLPLQVWHWIDPEHYETTFYLVADDPQEPRVLRSTARYYAVPIPRLLGLLERAGFEERQRLDDVLYQPVLVGRRPAANAG